MARLSRIRPRPALAPPDGRIASPAKTKSCRAYFSFQSRGDRPQGSVKGTSASPSALPVKAGTRGEGAEERGRDIAAKCCWHVAKERWGEEGRASILGAVHVLPILSAGPHLVLFSSVKQKTRLRVRRTYNNLQAYIGIRDGDGNGKLYKKTSRSHSSVRISHTHTRPEGGRLLPNSP